MSSKSHKTTNTLLQKWRIDFPDNSRYKKWYYMCVHNFMQNVLQYKRYMHGWSAKVCANPSPKQESGTNNIKFHYTHRKSTSESPPGYVENFPHTDVS